MFFGKNSNKFPLGYKKRIKISKAPQGERFEDSKIRGFEDLKIREFEDLRIRELPCNFQIFKFSNPRRDCPVIFKSSNPQRELPCNFQIFKFSNLQRFEVMLLNFVLKDSGKHSVRNVSLGRKSRFYLYSCMPSGMQPLPDAYLTACERLYDSFSTER